MGTQYFEAKDNGPRKSERNLHELFLKRFRFLSLFSKANMTFWKPGTVAPGSEELAEKTSALDRENEAESNVTQTYNPNAKLSIQQQKLRLPIFQYKTQILYLVETYQVVVIVGETGCGKTTQIPQYLHEAKWTGDGKMIGCTQPRRIAATSVAARVAEEVR